MLLNHIAVALRHLNKNRLFTGLNIVGLSIGLSAGLLILIWAQDEWSFDNYHADVDRIYRENANLKSGDEVRVWENTPAPHAAYALREIPEVEKAVRVGRAGSPLTRYKETVHIEKKGAFVDTSFFEVFKTETIAGNARQPFGDINSIVVSESFARKYFGANAQMSGVVGAVIEMDKKPLTISAVIRDFPENTHLKYDFLRPFEYLKVNYQGNSLWKTKEDNWGDFNDATYLKLREGASIAAVEKKLSEIQHAHNSYDKDSYYTLQPLTSLRLYAADGGDAGAQTARIMSIAALFILIIACINYINMATAKASKRALEVGMRKAIGARRGQLISQFLVESALVFLIASGLAITFTYILLPWCNDLTDKKMRIDWANLPMVLLVGGVLFGALLLSAVYPSVILSAFSPLRVMKGQLGAGRDSQAFLRKGLVVVQFVFSAALLFSMLVIGRQMDFIRNKNLGFDRSYVFGIELSEATYNNRNTILQELKNAPGVKEVTSASDNLLSIGSTTGDTKWDGKTADQNMLIVPMSVAPDFLPFFKMPLAAGAGFTGTKADSTSFIINEAAAAQMGMKDPVGKRFQLWQTEGTIVGVAKDFHFTSLRQTIKPAVFISNPEWHGVIYVKTSGAEAAKAVRSAEQLWKQFDSSYPFNYTFMDEAFEKMYQREHRTAVLFKGFSFIAMLISCLGLFGLSAFMVERRFKEIGIRKVLGASTGSITALLSKEFLQLVLLAVVIAAPAAWWTMNRWLEDFAYRIEIQWHMIAMVAALAVLIAFATVSFQSVKAALANPIRSLRSE